MTASDGMAPAVRSILAAARDRSPPDRPPVSVTPRDVTAAFERTQAAGDVPIIGEIKPTSPTSEHRRDDDPVALAEAIVEGGATAVSVLTEPEHFGGSPEALRRVREAVDVPVLRKDFILSPDQLDVVRADLVLVIARFVDDVPELVTAAQERGFQVLVETHDREEVSAAVNAGADVIGINNRDLAELSVDLGTFEDVAPAVPEDIPLIAESGISSPADVRRMRTAGADALLVGSAIMAGDDVTRRTRRLVEAEQ